jgi:hypothetical protein
MDSAVIASIIGAIAVIIAAILPNYLKQKSSAPQEISNINKGLDTGNAQKKSLKTWAGKSEFEYMGSVKDGTTIIVGESRQITEVSSEQYKQLIKHFSGRTVKVGAVQSSDSEPGTLDEWLKNNVTKRMIATYVASILNRESYARNSKGKIEFNL